MQVGRTGFLDPLPDADDLIPGLATDVFMQILVKNMNLDSLADMRLRLSIIREKTVSDNNIPDHCWRLLSFKHDCYTSNGKESEPLDSKQLDNRVIATITKYSKYHSLLMPSLFDRASMRPMSIHSAAS